MEEETLLPKRLAKYIRDVGVRAFDRLADTAEGNEAVRTLVGHWRSLTEADKQQFVDRVAAAVVEVVAATKMGKKAAKSARKVLKKRSKQLRKSVKKKKAKLASETA